MQFTQKLSGSGESVPHPYEITISRRHRKFKVWTLVFILLMMCFLSAIAQTNLIIVTDWTESTEFALHVEDLTESINILVNTGNGGEISLVFITDHVPKVISLHISPFAIAASRTALDVIRNREAKTQYRKLVKREVWHFLSKVKEFVSSTPKFKGSDINAAIDAVNIKLNEPHLTGHNPIVIFQTDGCQSRKMSNECLCAEEKISTQTDGDSIMYVGWQKKACRPTDNHTAYSALDGALRYTSNFLIK